MERWIDHASVPPASNLFRVREFLEYALVKTRKISNILDSFEQDTGMVEDNDEVFEPIPQTLKPIIESECSLEDLSADSEQVMANSQLAAFVGVYHERWRSADHPTLPKSTKASRLKLLAEQVNFEFERRLEEPDAAAARETLDSVKLQSWVTSPDAHFFVRPIATSDKSTLSSPKPKPLADEEADSSFSNEDSVALLTFTNFERSTHPPHDFRPVSKQIILSSQTLGDLWDNLPCDRKVLPVESEKHSSATVTKLELPSNSVNGVAICIEDIVYGDGVSKPDYSERLADYIIRKGPGLAKRGGLMHDTKLSDVELRLHQAYWLLHQGECDHLLIFDQVRLPHPTDPRTGYPYTIHRTPSLHPLCRICDRFAAELSIVGDVRIGEAVALVCRSCWKALGEPKPSSGSEGKITVVPLLYERNA